MFKFLNPVTKSILELQEEDKERFERYQLNWLYYKGEQYIVDLGKAYAKEQKLFKHMRRVFDCVTHTVDTDARFVMKQELGIDAEDEFREIITDMWERSNFQAEKYKLVRYGANLGDAFLILQNIGDENNVIPRIIVANSEDMTIKKNPDDQTKTEWARQSYIFVDENGKTKTRDWVFFDDRIERYTDEKLDEGYPQPHVFGRVPVVHIKALDIGEAYGLCSWHNVQGQIDEVNELGSFANKIMLRYADPTIVASGMTPDSRATMRKGINEDNVYYLPNAEAKLSLLEYQGMVLPHVLEAMEKIEANIKEQLPEQSLNKIRDQSGLSGYSVSLQAAELIAKIQELRGNFANGLELINSLAIRAVQRSNAPLEEFANRIVYEPIFPEDVTEKFGAWRTETELGLAGRRELWRRQGLTEQEIEEIKTEIDEEINEEQDRTYSARVGNDLKEIEDRLLQDFEI